MKSLKPTIYFTLLCLASHAYSGYNNPKSPQPGSPNQHHQPLAPKVPLTKLGNKAEKIDLGSCPYLDYYIYYCKPYTCSLKMPVPGEYKLTFYVKGHDSQNICNINYNIDTVSKSGDKIPFKIRCKLTKDGLESLRYQWKYYSSGYVDVFTRRSDDPLLKKQCQASIEM